MESLVSKGMLGRQAAVPPWTSHFDKFASELENNHRDLFATIKALIEYLDQERAAHPQQWPELVRSCREHELHSLLLQDPLTCRAFTKPRGYPGDAVMLDFIYGHQDARDLVARSSVIGQRVLEYTGGGAFAARAVRWRCARAAQEIEAAAARHPNARILAFACGHLREVELVHPELRRRIQVIAADIDDESLKAVAKAYGPECAVECRRISAKDLMLNRHGLDFGYDLIYSLGLFDYLTDKIVERLMPALWSLLAPGGKLMVANFTPQIEDKAYMEVIMDWWLQYRSVEALRVWAALVDPQTVIFQESFSDPFGQVAYLSLGKC